MRCTWRLDLNILIKTYLCRPKQKTKKQNVYNLIVHDQLYIVFPRSGFVTTGAGTGDAR